MYNLFRNLQHQAQLQQANLSAQESAHQSDRARHSVYDVEARLERLLLVCQAMWSLLTEVSDLTEDDLSRRITELDLQDGQLDGRVAKPVVQCANCDSAISHKFRRCLFCGEEYRGGSPFSTV